MSVYTLAHHKVCLTPTLVMLREREREREVYLHHVVGLQCKLPAVQTSGYVLSLSHLCNFPPWLLYLATVYKIWL